MKTQGKKTRFLWVGLTLIAGLAILTGAAAANDTSPQIAADGSVINLEGLAAGTIVDSVSTGKGMTGDVVSGVVKVFGFSQRTGNTTNAAMIFDSTCPPQNLPVSCTGGDRDLFKPEMGKVLIVSEDLDSNDPDDSDAGNSTLEFDFSGWGTGTAMVESLTVMDIEEDQHQGDARIQLYSGGKGGTLLETVDIPHTGNNGTATVAVGVSGVDYMVIKLNGSGAVDNLKVHAAEVMYLSHTGTLTDGLSYLYQIEIDEAQGRANLTLLPNGIVNYNHVDAIASPPDGSRLYLINDVIDKNVPANSKAILAYYDLTTHTVTEVGVLKSGGQKLVYHDQAAFAPDGTFYMVGSETDVLYTVNPATAEATARGKVVNAANGVTLDVYGGDIAFHADGTLYMWTIRGRQGAPIGFYRVPLTPQNGLIRATFISGATDTHQTFRGMAVRHNGTGDLVKAGVQDTHIFSRVDGKDVFGPVQLYLDGVVFTMAQGDMTIGPFAP